MTDEFAVDAVESPSFNVEVVSETEKSRRRRFQEARTRAKRRGTWLLGSWTCLLTTIAAAWFCEGTDRGSFVAFVILGGAVFTGMYGVYYACQVGFIRALLGKSGIGEMPWSSVVWVTLWSTLVGGFGGFALAMLIVRDHRLPVFLCACGAYLVGATLGNRLAHRKYARMQSG